MKIENIPFLLVIISLLVSTVILRFTARLLFGSKTYLNEEIAFIVVLLLCDYIFSNFLLRTVYLVAVALIGVFDTSGVYIEFVTSKLPIIIFFLYLLLIFIICAYSRGRIEIGTNREKIGFEKIGFVKGGILVIIQFTSFFLLLFCMSKFGYF